MQGVGGSDHVVVTLPELAGHHRDKQGDKRGTPTPFRTDRFVVKSIIKGIDISNAYLHNKLV